MTAPDTSSAPAAPIVAVTPGTVELVRYTTRREMDAAFLAAHPAAMRAIRAAFPALASVTTVRLSTTDERTTWMDVAA